MSLGMKHIYRHLTRGRIEGAGSGWQVTINRSNRQILSNGHITRRFADVVFGGKENALIVAKLCRDATVKIIEAREKRYQDSLKGKRDSTGERNFNACITPEEVKQIRTLRTQKATLREIQEIRDREGKHRLSLKQLSMISTGERWGHLLGALKKRWVRGSRGHCDVTQSTQEVSPPAGGQTPCEQQ